MFTAISASSPTTGVKISDKAKNAPASRLHRFAMTATEVLGEEKYPYLRRWGGPDLDRTLSGGVIVGESEPLREWQVFLWTPR